MRSGSSWGALALFGPLYWTQSMLEKGITEVRRQARQGAVVRV